MMSHLPRRTAYLGISIALTALFLLFTGTSAEAQQQPKPPKGYNFCANENEVCSFEGTQDVAFGANGRFRYKKGVSGRVTCDDPTFGDPIQGVVKACFVTGDQHQSSAPPIPDGYSFCSKENEACTFGGTQNVAYGANGVFRIKLGVSGGIACNDDTFGDPLVGVVKACYVSAATTATQQAQFAATAGGTGAQSSAPQHSLDEPKPRNAKQLVPGQPQDGTLSGGGQDNYSVTLSAGQYIKIAVDQRGVDVTVSLLSSDGTMLANVDTMNGTQGIEPLCWVAQASGDYFVQVSPLDSQAPSGQYSIRIVEVRTAVADDQTRVAGQDDLWKGRVLMQTNAADSLQQATSRLRNAYTEWQSASDTERVSETTGRLLNAYASLENLSKDQAVVANLRTEAINVFLPAANQGNALAEVAIGEIYSFVDPAESLKWYQKAADSGDVGGENMLGNIYFIGQGVKQDYSQALNWYRKAAEQGNANSESHLGTLYSQGLGVQQDYAAAMGWFQKSAAQGDLSSMYSIGMFYENGQGVSQDYTEAMKWFQKAGGLWTAAVQIGLLYENGWGVKQDYAEALKWFQKYALSENGAFVTESQACYELGRLYQNGWGVRKNQTEAMKWFQKAAETGYPDAIKWMTEQGTPDAQAAVGSLYYNGRGVVQDYAQAMQWYQKAADHGNVDAQSSLGDMYFNGQGVAQNYPEAMKWFQKAAGQGNAHAQNQIGWMLQNSLGVKKNLNEAVKWFEKAASQGFAVSENNLANYYYLGAAGLKQNYAQAMDLFQKAAAQGEPNAETSLGTMFEQGQGVQQNYVTALGWYQKAADQGDKDAIDAVNRLRTAHSWELAQSYETSNPPDLQDAVQIYDQLCSANRIDACERLVALGRADSKVRDTIVQHDTAICAQTGQWQAAEASCKKLVDSGMDSATVRENLAAAMNAEEESYSATCAQSNEWQAAEAACKKLLDLGEETDTARANLAAAAQAEAQAKEQERQDRIAQLQQDLQEKLDEAEQAEKSAADLQAQSDTGTLADAIGQGAAVVFQNRAQNLRQQASQDQSELEDLTGQDYQAEIDASVQRSANYQPQPDLINQTLRQQLGQLNQVAQRQPQQPLTPQQQQAAQKAQQIMQQYGGSQPAGSAASSTVPPASAPGADYSGQYADWVHLLLRRAGSYTCPSSMSAQDGVPPAVSGTEPRDLYVKAAVQNAWAAECYAQQEHDNEAQAQAQAMIQNLQAAQSLCSNILGATPCETSGTYNIYKCGEIEGNVKACTAVPSTAYAYFTWTQPVLNGQATAVVIFTEPLLNEDYQPGNLFLAASAKDDQQARAGMLAYMNRTGVPGDPASNWTDNDVVGSQQDAEAKMQAAFAKTVNDMSAWISPVSYRLVILDPSSGAVVREVQLKANGGRPAAPRGAGVAN